MQPPHAFPSALVHSGRRDEILCVHDAARLSPILRLQEAAYIVVGLLKDPPKVRRYGIIEHLSRSSLLVKGQTQISVKKKLTRLVDNAVSLVSAIWRDFLASNNTQQWLSQSLREIIGALAR